MSSLTNILKSSYKEDIQNFLISYLEQKQKEYQDVSLQTQEIIKKLSQFSISGKFVRGSLVCFTYEQYKKQISEDVIKVAAAIELIHSAFLIHDDIMDQDFIRRKQKTIFAQYEEIGKKHKLLNPLHYGESVGICIGDIAYFLGFLLLGEIKNVEIISFCASEFSKVAIAQIDDIYNGMSIEELTENQILSVYKFKTGRYTFSMPFILGALLADQEKQTKDTLEKFGEILGILFQLKDDELGLFDREEIVGKPIGSDIKENKKTLLRKYLFNSVSSSEKERIKKIFGNSKNTKKDIAYVLQLFEKYNIKKKVMQLQDSLASDARQVISNMNKDKKEALLELLSYNIQREK